MLEKTIQERIKKEKSNKVYMVSERSDQYKPTYLHIYWWTGKKVDHLHYMVSASKSYLNNEYLTEEHKKALRYLICREKEMLQKRIKQLIEDGYEITPIDGTSEYVLFELEVLD